MILVIERQAITADAFRLCALRLNPLGIATAWRLSVGMFIAAAVMALTVSIALRDPSVGRFSTDEPQA
ncbi:MAG TPA: hypothetical protein VGR45_02715 [Stellaceae bacterium]|nr:hypothetical protein [Stellaceae bacterium]